jgi:hypothetical protein
MIQVLSQYISGVDTPPNSSSEPSQAFIRSTISLPARLIKSGESASVAGTPDYV